ncbi:TonB-dependent receptor [Pedobacter sp. JCM 36344]|uniref:TonB-dependent receptor n=1 Tax=Pedobacter sp. JCM 36344 TaxID=3374280 RepID=UPI003979C51A
MNFKRSVLALALISLISFAFIKKGVDPVDNIVTALQKWNDTNPQEKVYLQTDKPYYVVGDTIWFKAYVTIGNKHQLSAMSGALFVDLITESDSLATALKLPITAGKSKGNFVLADSSFREGNYRIRAYTQWMRNAGSSYYYDKVFSIGNSVTNPVFAKIDYEFSKDGAKNVVTAVLTYTNDKGEPMINKSVNYDLLENYEVITSQSKKTDGEGIVRVVLQPGKSGKIDGTVIHTKINTIDKEVIVKDFAVNAVSSQTDVQFFPESGPLVNGLRSRVAFKATGPQGIGVPVKGIVTDESNTTVAEFEAANFGMGYFRLQPEAGKSYQAKVTYPDGSEKIIKLPAAIDNGYVLSVFNNPETDTILVRVNASKAAVAAGQSLSLVAQTGGSVHYASAIPLNKPAFSIMIPTKELPSGIVQFTLFSAAGDPINERIAFVQSNDLMNLKLSTTKQTYAPKEKIEVTLEALDQKSTPLRGDFSVSVINEASVPVDETKESSILSHILLSSDIKGYIEKPGYYFSNPSIDTKTNLDILMMTQGYRRFAWKDIMSANPMNLPFKAEKLTSEIKGKLVTLNKKALPVIGGQVVLMNNKLGLIGTQITDATGSFKFSDLLMTNELKFTVSGLSEKGSKNVEISVDKVRQEIMTPNPNRGDLDTDLRKTLQASFDNSKKQEEDIQKRGMLGRTQQLKEVKITSGKKKRRFGLDMIMDGHADQTVRFQQGDVTFMNLLEWLKFRVPNIQFRQDDSEECGLIFVAVSRNEVMKILVDGRPISPCESQDFFQIDPADIDRLDIVRTNQALINMIGGAALSFTTRRGVGMLRTTYTPNVINISPRGYNIVREFYSPVYKNDGNDSRVADLRSTLYWNPSVMTGVDGKAKFSFFNSDGLGTHRVLVEGINAEGILGRQIFRYEVK